MESANTKMRKRWHWHIARHPAHEARRPVTRTAMHHCKYKYKYNCKYNYKYKYKYKYKYSQTSYTQGTVVSHRHCNVPLLPTVLTLTLTSQHIGFSELCVYSV